MTTRIATILCLVLISQSLAPGCNGGAGTASAAAANSSTAGAPDAAVRDVFARYERAIQSGDGKAYCALHSQRARGEDGLTEDFSFPPRKEYRLLIDRVLVRARTAAVLTHLGHTDEPQHVAYALVREEDAWRIDHETGGNEPIDGAWFLPPESGRFLEAGAPWDRVQATPEPPTGGAATARVCWQAARDESFLYVRASYAQELPAPGSLFDTSLESLAELGFDAAGAGVVVRDGAAEPIRFDVDLGTSSRSTFGAEAGAATLGYSLSVQADGGGPRHWTFADSNDGLLDVAGRALVARIPLETLHAAEDSTVTVEVGTFGSRVTCEPARF